MAFTLVGNGSTCQTAQSQRDEDAEKAECGSQYHCLRNQCGQLGRVCAKPSWIHAGNTK